jgi:hypothetical protein
MFCPRCGSNQGEGKKFCTACGTNLAIVSRALSGELPVAHPPPYQPPAPSELERQRQMTQGVKLTIIGGAFVAVQFLKFLFSLPWGGGGSLFSGWGLVGLIIAAIGLAKIVSSRPVYSLAVPPMQPPLQAPHLNSPPVLSETQMGDEGEAATIRLASLAHPPEVTEETTRRLEYALPDEVKK